MTEDMQSVISPISEIILEAKKGRPFILVDAEDRENEGDIIIPAQMASKEWINFMARYARGLICLAMTRERAEALKLPPMAQDNGSRNTTAFTVAIEAREGVTTGISASDRAHTIAVAIDPQKGSEDLVRPGHVFPLVARDGGVLVRAGHTEAAVDISRLAGLNPSGVICEIMNDDGTMARLNDLEFFGKAHNMKIGTIADLIAYRRRNERFVEKVLERPFNSEFGGPFRLLVYRNQLDQSEHIALVKGNPTPSEPVLVRMHALDIAYDVLHTHTESGRTQRIEKALKILTEHSGPAVFVLLRDPSSTVVSSRFGIDDTLFNKPKELRDYGVGAQILLDIGVKDMILLGSKQPKPAALDGYGLRIKDTLLL
jgi:3,4-dihydroxy 2-butanone 4-phosphate synthase/GTP cyclohydrolase II